MRPINSPKLFAAVAFVLIAHFVAIAALAVCPELHQLLHADAHHDDHECAVTLFAHGSVDSSAPPVFAIEFARIEVFDSARVRAGHVPCCHLPGGILEHAPPAVS